MQIIWNVMLYSQHFTCHWKLLVIYVMLLMFNKMADAERSAAVIHTVPDEVPSEQAWLRRRTFHVPNLTE